MMNATLIRCSIELQCVRGVLLVDGLPVCVTLELPWRQNEKGKSCVPLGDYSCFERPAKSTITGGKGKAFELENVPGRDGILIHVANTPHQLQGCIAVGASFSHGRYGEPMIADSRQAFDKLFRALKGERTFTLSIIDALRRPYEINQEDEPCSTGTIGNGGRTAQETPMKTTVKRKVGT